MLDRLLAEGIISPLGVVDWLFPTPVARSGGDQRGLSPSTNASCLLRSDAWHILDCALHHAFREAVAAGPSHYRSSAAGAADAEILVPASDELSVEAVASLRSLLRVVLRGACAVLAALPAEHALASVPFSSYKLISGRLQAFSRVYGVVAADLVEEMCSEVRRCSEWGKGWGRGIALFALSSA